MWKHMWNDNFTKDISKSHMWNDYSHMRSVSISHKILHVKFYLNFFAKVLRPSHTSSNSIWDLARFSKNCCLNSAWRGGGGFSPSRYTNTKSERANQHSLNSCVADILESLSKRRFCQHRRQPEVSWVDIDGEWWRQPFLFEIMNVKVDWLPLLILNEDGWRHHSPSITMQLTSGCRPCWQKRRLLKLSIMLLTLCS